ncbi:lysophospholipid acyltransferase family protein [Sporomusa acidovorans]|uniref:Lipid A biosynthesis lauroyltransferase n=1 Tax=Sporomusa acidovorans (strain ATCC 49682 / DSM 3132 / Mol) TaxID=1123286 RepID=A0ABZ3J7Q9_SPOA4|nr:lysophospholipid acyltransferase family protein [Sporomusa acidovorans]OZC19290.1 phosphatidylinositol mannoside acyltransferase [Sporomusa acidovorans DSM 3132]SDD81751.1 KDO2-lipid IV(A) lauroyltransferase [Sporomusa acidovorans]
MLYYLVKALSRLVCRLPLTIRHTIGIVIGRICWPLVPAKRRQMAVENISCSLGVSYEQAAAIAKASGVRFGPMFMEVLHMPRLKRENIHEYVALTGGEHLEAALRMGRGAVLATAHSGNWELLGAALAMHGFPLVAVVQRQTNAAMDAFINEYRTKAGMHVTYKQGVREMVKLLAAGKIIGLLMDQDNHRDGVFVEFFGRLASTPQGAAALARLNNAPIVPAFITENPDGTHTAILHPPVMVTKTADRTEDIRKTTQYLTHIIEQHIRQHPREWFWLHNRWKTPPPKTKD